MPLTPAAKALKQEILSIPRTKEAFLDDLPEGLSPEEIEHLHHLALSGAKHAVPELKKYIARFPRYPTLLNYLRVSHQIQNRNRQADEVLRQLAIEHPDYLFTRVGLSMKALDAGDIAGAETALGPELDIRKLYPERAVFHVSEMRNYYIQVAALHARRGDTELAHGVRSALEAIIDDPEAQQLILREIMLANMKKMREAHAEDEKHHVEVEIPPLPKKPTGLARPAFHHPETAWLYQHDVDLPAEKIHAILALPRQSLVEDLGRVLDDCVARTPDFMRGRVAGEGTCAAFHAIHFLAEIHGTEALDHLLGFMSLHPDAVEFWLGDFSVCAQISRIISADIPRCLEWLKSPGINHRSKNVITEAMEILARFHSERRPEIVDALAGLMRFLLDAKPGDNVLDTRLVSLLVTDLATLRAQEQLPLIEEAYRKNRVEKGFIGTLETTVAEMSAPPPALKPMKPIADQYLDYLDPDSSPPVAPGAWNDPDPFDLFGDGESEDSAPEVGRNDPCPCGSGKKYKKCCMD